MAVTKSVGTPGLASQNPVAHRLGTNAVHYTWMDTALKALADPCWTWLWNV